MTTIPATGRLCVIALTGLAAVGCGGAAKPDPNEAACEGWRRFWVATVGDSNTTEEGTELFAAARELQRKATDKDIVNFETEFTELQEACRRHGVEIPTPPLPPAPQPLDED